MANSGLPDSEVRTCTVDPHNSDIVYAGTGGSGVFKSINGGNSWSAINNGLANLWVSVLVIEPQDPATIYAANDVDPGAGVFKTIDGGASWSKVTDITTRWTFALAIDPNNSQIVYAATLDGVSKSTNGAVTWNDSSAGLPRIGVYAIAIDPENHDTLYAGTTNAPGGGLFKRTDAGNNWKKIGAGLLPTPIRAIVLDPRNPRTIYLATWYQGIYTSGDGGLTWTEMNSGLDNPYVRAVVIKPGDSSLIYAGTLGSGVFVTGAITPPRRRP
jgi:photosystem II stability/assembly factor-like uncharacterized protein